MAADERIRVFGEDVADARRRRPRQRRGQGRRVRHHPRPAAHVRPARCYNTPLAEANIVGRAVGQALRGLRPCAEIQFFDYIWPAMQQIKSEAATIRWRSNGAFTCPMVLRVADRRLPDGRGDLALASAASRSSPTSPACSWPSRRGPATPSGCCARAFACEDPVLFLEHKHLLRQPLRGRPVPAGRLRASLRRGATCAGPGDDLHHRDVGRHRGEVAQAAAERLDERGVRGRGHRPAHHLAVGPRARRRVGGPHAAGCSSSTRTPSPPGSAPRWRPGRPSTASRASTPPCAGWRPPTPTSPTSPRWRRRSSPRSTTSSPPPAASPSPDRAPGAVGAGAVPPRQHHHVDRVVVIGGGFAGLAATRRLGGHAVAVTLVDRHNFHTFLPLLYQVATAGLEPADIAYPVRTRLRARAQRHLPPRPRASVDIDARAVHLADGDVLPTTTWSWPPAPPRSSSGSPARPSTPVPSTRWATPAGCATTSWPRWRRPTPTPRRSTAARRCSSWSGAGADRCRDGGRTGRAARGLRAPRPAAHRPRALARRAGRRRGPGPAGLPQAPPVATPRETLAARGVEIRLDAPVAEVTPDGVRFADGDLPAAPPPSSGPAA